MSVTPILMPHPGYNLLYTFPDFPTRAEIENFADYALAIRPSTENLEPNESVEAEVGQVRLTLLEKPTPEQCARLRARPVLRQRRGTDQEPVTIDAEIWKDEPFDRASMPPPFEFDSLTALPGNPKSKPESPSRAPEDPSLHTILKRVGVLDAQKVLGEMNTHAPLVIAVIDISFASDEPFVERIALRRPHTPVSFVAGGAHGTLVRHVIAEILPGSAIQIRRIQIPTHPHASAYVTPADLAVAIAHAVAPRNIPEGFEQLPPPADVVVIAMSTGQWGTPFFLDAIVTEAVRAGRQGKGAVIVCSTGSPADNQTALVTTGCEIDDRNPLCMSSARPSAAHGADELGAHPDVVLVAPCDIAGRWLRRFGDRPIHDIPDGFQIQTGITGRMGPSVTVSAPGAMTYLEVARTRADESSLASALIGGIVGQMLLANPTLEAAEVRRLLAQTAMIPTSVDSPYGAESANLSNFGRDRHNFKVGGGMVNALAAVLAARDPICQMLLHVATPSPPSAELHGLIADPALLIARWFDHWACKHAPHAEHYRALRGGLTRLMFVSWPLREEVGWVLRHLLAVFTYDGSHSWFTPSKTFQSNHGALRRRLRRLVTTLRHELEREGTRFGIPEETGRVWVNLLDKHVAHVDDATMESFLHGAFLGYGVDLEEPKSSLDAHLAPYPFLSRYELGIGAVPV